MLWNAAAPRLPPAGEGGSAAPERVAQATGNNAFSALRLDAMWQTWSKILAREKKLEENATPRDEDSSAYSVCDA